MNPEELQLIASTITTLGAAGKTAFIWWLVADKLLPALVWLATLATLLKFAHGPITQWVVSTKATTYLKHLRDSWDIGSPGYLSDAELRAIQQRIDRLAMRNPHQEDAE